MKRKHLKRLERAKRRGFLTIPRDANEAEQSELMGAWGMDCRTRQVPAISVVSLGRLAVVGFVRNSVSKETLHAFLKEDQGIVNRYEDGGVCAAVCDSRGRADELARQIVAEV